MVNTIKVPPDGGYGWVIVLANALSNVIIFPLIQCFGLIFKDTFAEMGLSATEGSLIINLNAAFGMLMGLLNGVLLKIYGYRKIAMAASCLITCGIILTSYAKTFTHFMIAYGLITSLGMGMNMSAYSLALNSFFRKKKGKAVGYAMTLTGLGPILMPQLINVLLKLYGVQGATLILGAIAAHCFVSASLLQPIEWYMKTEIVEEEKLEDENKENEAGAKPKLGRSISQMESQRRNSIKASNQSLDEIENAPIFGLDSAFDGSVISLHSMRRKASIVSQSWKKGSVISLQRSQKDNIYNELSRPKKQKPYWKRWIHFIVKFFDLDLLKDPIYVNILIGLSIAIFAEINFSLLTAFILAEFGLDTDQIAIFMSILGIADIIFRFLAPYIANFMKLSARPMYMVSLALLMISRFSLLISNNFIVLLGVALGLGIAKGFRTVYMSLVIPTYVPIEKLASATGLQMMINGFCILIGGPIIGIIRDHTGNYRLCIVILNLITMTTIVLWSLEAVIQKFKKPKTTEPSEQTNTLLNKS